MQNDSIERCIIIVAVARVLISVRRAGAILVRVRAVRGAKKQEHDSGRPDACRGLVFLCHRELLAMRKSAASQSESDRQSR